MVRDSSGESGRRWRVLTSVVPVIVACASQSRRKSEIAVRRWPPHVAVHACCYPSVAVPRRLPVFAAWRSLAPRVAGNALAQRIPPTNAWFRGSH